MNVDQEIQRAIQHHQAKQLAEAEAIYRRILQQNPNHPDALRLLGMVAMQTGHSDAAIELLSRSIQAKPDIAETHASLGNILAMKGRLDDAISAYERALQLKPDYFEVCNNLGNTMQLSGRLDDAIAWYRRAVQINPDFADAHANLGHSLLGKGQIDQAIAASRRAIECNPNYSEAYNNLGNGLAQKGKLDEAIAAYQRAIQFGPNLFQAHNNLGNTLKDKGHVTAAIGAFERAIQIQPNSAETHTNLGNTLMQKGQVDHAIVSYRHAMELKPQSPEMHGNLLFALIHHPDRTPESLLSEHLEWGERYARPLASNVAPHANDPSPSRRLRIGYVSSDFYRHSVASFFMPLVENHDRTQFEIFCYANVRKPDAMTDKMKQQNDVWRDILPLSDDAAAKQIRDDGVDILVDLSGHTSNNRLLVFARKPAPVQVTYLGYANTTGMTAIDYRLTDSLADPPGMTEMLHTEQLWRLPTCAWCYQPPADAPEIRPREAGPIIFGCFNAFPKLTPKMLDLWAKLMARVPDSRLVLKSSGGGDPSSQKSLRGRFAAHGIAGERIEMVGWIENPKKHLDYYHQIDIALDTYPYHGTTTTCEALWMGVPVVSLMGQTHISRVGVSLLTNAGLPELIAASPDEYVNIAAELAGNPSRLAELRMGLRERMRTGPLLDGKRFTSEIESAFRQMWIIWCERQATMLPK
ncbi:MAG: tetratricopeptide repeat protein [Tepidisphaeraceae bacterium]|jgi:predicted O-linked N-acetylglucosamine transferase (SPINDLY family)